MPIADEESSQDHNDLAASAYMFPPSPFYARQLDDGSIEMIEVDADWGYWDAIGEGPVD